MDEASTSASGGSAGRGGRSFPPARSGVFYRFTQQDLPAWKPAMTPGCVITIFLIIGITFVPIGLVCLQASNSVAEIVHRYDIDCVPNAYRGNKQAYIKDSSISKKCIQKVQVRYRMKAPIYVYYELDNFYQNHRRYVKSRSDKQLRHGLKHTESSCSPIESSNGLPIVPCGLIAWSLFNDTYDFTRGSKEIMVDRKNISWRSDREHKFGKDVYPFNFQNGSLIGGGKLDPDATIKCRSTSLDLSHDKSTYRNSDVDTLERHDKLNLSIDKLTCRRQTSTCLGQLVERQVIYLELEEEMNDSDMESDADGNDDTQDKDQDFEVDFD